jgi:hypothetical protein
MRSSVGEYTAAILPARCQAPATVAGVAREIHLAAVRDTPVAVLVVRVAASYSAHGLAAPASAIVKGAGTGRRVALAAAFGGAFTAVLCVYRQLGLATILVNVIAIVKTWIAFSDDALARTAGSRTIGRDAQVATGATVSSAITQVRFAFSVPIAVPQPSFTNSGTAAVGIAKDGLVRAVSFAHVAALSAIAYVAAKVPLAAILQPTVAIVKARLAIHAAASRLTGRCTVDFHADTEAGAAVAGVLIQVDLAAVVGVPVAVLPRCFALDNGAGAANALWRCIGQVTGCPA